MEAYLAFMQSKKEHDKECRQKLWRYYMSMELKNAWLGLWIAYMMGEGQV